MFTMASQEIHSSLSFRKKYQNYINYFYNAKVKKTRVLFMEKLRYEDNQIEYFWTKMHLGKEVTHVNIL